MRTIRWLRAACLLAAALGLTAWTACAADKEVAAHPQPVIENLQLDRYDEEDSQRLTVRAARGYAAARRVGFLRVAALPAIELEAVDLEYKDESGNTRHEHLDRALLDWQQKRITTLWGKPLHKSKRR